MSSNLQTRYYKGTKQSRTIYGGPAQFAIAAKSPDRRERQD
jgi:hypothetical protein